ncbi:MULTISPECIES: hypothetical protein [Protofrankia]|uniref:Uncharacterized protein n=1 Tax=Candidatus Protofrankia datiscae TaxID=2716812 RepID=F8B1Y7_9ACTN|nr:MULTISPECIES: hypothetical protein [Protofrankia]AEH08856.1 hypothetical protein FsymDg_1384 [Candidatus Protofrankia datiscae]
MLDDLSKRQVPRLVAGAGDRREEAMAALEQLLLRALLEDLSNPPTRGLQPRRRRRTARPVLLVPLPHGEASQAAEVARVERFLSAFCEMRKSAHAPGPLVIAIGQPSDALLDQIGPLREVTLGAAGYLLHEPDSEPGFGYPVLVPISDESFSLPGLPIRRVEPKTFRLDWRTVNALITVKAILLLALASTLPPWRGEPHDCVRWP